MSVTGVSVEDILVKAQETPNPYAIKFICNFGLKTSGKATFSSPIEAEGLPLVHSLFAIPGVIQVYLYQNTATVTHLGDLDNHVLIEQVVAVLKSRSTIHDPDFLGPQEAPEKPKTQDRSHLSEELQKIEEILDRTIRPGLQADGGDVEVLGFENNELRIIYQGACGGCPSSLMGTLDAIQNILRHEMNNDHIVVMPI